MEISRRGLFGFAALAGTAVAATQVQAASTPEPSRPVCLPGLTEAESERIRPYLPYFKESKDLRGRKTFAIYGDDLLMVAATQMDPEDPSMGRSRAIAHAMRPLSKWARSQGATLTTFVRERPSIGPLGPQRYYLPAAAQFSFDRTILMKKNGGYQVLKDSV